MDLESEDINPLYIHGSRGLRELRRGRQDPGIASVSGQLTDGTVH